MNVIDARYDIIRFNPISDVYPIALGYSICTGIAVPDTYEERCDYILRHRIHESPLEHSSMTVLFTVNRAIANEIVRHRHTAYSQESTRYCNYSKKKYGSELTFINNTALAKSEEAYRKWLLHMTRVEAYYLDQLELGLKPEEARDGLDLALASKLLVTTNFREWRNIFKLRCDTPAHYQMREVMRPLLAEVTDALPCVFDDIDIH